MIRARYERMGQSRDTGLLVRHGDRRATRYIGRDQQSAVSGNANVARANQYAGLKSLSCRTHSNPYFPDSIVGWLSNRRQC